MRMRTRLRSLARAALVAVLTVLSAEAAVAQGASTTGQIRGRVVDPAGGAVPSVSVVARNTETGFSRGALTDREGQYSLRLLPPGTYDVTATLIGRQPEQTSGVAVTVGSAATVNFTLSEEAIALEGITVTAGNARVDATEGGVKQLVGAEQIEDLPTLGRDFSSFVTLSGLVSPDPGETTGGKFSIAGQRASQTNVQIDGVDANNAFFGENRGGSRIPFVFSLESIREFQIITNGYDVEHGRYTGGVVNAVTKGGGNELRGSAYVNYRGDALTANTFDDKPVQDYEVMQYAGTVSGPIKKDKAFYFVSVDGQRRREPNLPLMLSDYAPGGQFENPDAFRDVGRFFEILENQYGVQNPSSGYAPFQTTNDAVTLFGRVDVSLNDAHRLSVRHNFSHFTNANEWTERFDRIYGQSRAEEYKDVSHSFVTEVQSVFGANTFNVFRFQFANEDRPRNGNDLRPALEVNLSGGERIGYGGTFAAFQNDLRERKFQIIDNFTHIRGDHTFKLGTNTVFTNAYNRFIIQGAGTYFFPNLDAFAAYRPSSFSRNIQRGGGVPTVDFGATDFSVYAQDEWEVSPKLTATLGLRYDLQGFNDDPDRVIDAEQAFGLGTGTAPTDRDNISPRIALAYDLFADGRSVLRGGAGYFYGSIPLVLASNVASTAVPVVSVECAGSVVRGDADAPPPPTGFSEWDRRGNDNPSTCATEARASGLPEYSFWNDDFEYPETFKSNLGYEQLLGERTRVSLDLLFSQSRRLYTVQNLNLRSAQFALGNEAGRQIYQPEGGFDPAASDPTANEQRSRRNLELGPTYMISSDGLSRSYTASVEANHNFTRNSSLSASYTFTRAFDNSSFSCCTSSSGYRNVLVGAFGPNEIGGAGDFERAWGQSYFVRNHTVVMSGNARLPLGIGLSGSWQLRSGRPWTPAVQGDLNGDGVRFNDRPFVFTPENLPLASTGETAAEERQRYADHLEEWSCVADQVGEILNRNTCRTPWSNQLDLRVTRDFSTIRGQRAQLQIDLFNVLNGINSDWGKQLGIFGANTNLLRAVSYDAANDQVLYTVPENFGRTSVVGENLLLQFQAQIGLKYYF